MLSGEELAKASIACVHFAERDELPTDSADRLTWVDAHDRSLPAALGEALEFPEYFGGNWDAVEECLSDRDEDEVTVVCIRDARRLWAERSHECGLLVETWLAVLQQRAPDAAGFHLVFVW